MAYVQILANIQTLFNNVPSTFLRDDVAAGVGTITVDSIRDINVENILFIGEPGAEQSEIIQTHAVTAPTGNTVTLISNLVFAHDQSTKVYVVPYNQVEYSWASTIDGSKTILTTANIDADTENTVYLDSAHSGGYYFLRYKNSITNVFTDYSDPIPFTGWAENQVGAAIDYALKRNKTSLSETITHDFLIEEVNACLGHFNGKLKRWSRLQVFDYVLGQLDRGEYAVDLPDNCWKYSPKSILALRLGSGVPLIYRTKREFDDLLEGVEHTTLVNSATTGATSATVTNAQDLDDSGTIMVRGIEITYTAKNDTTGVLTGIPASGTGSITTNLSAGDDVWQGNVQESEPEYFTVVDGRVLVWPLADTLHAGKNLNADYWKEAVTVDTDGDTLDLNRYEAVKYWLEWSIRGMIKNDGKRDPNDAAFQLYSTTLADAMRLELSTQNQARTWKPRTNRIRHR